MFVVREDDVTVAGKVVAAWFDPYNPNEPQTYAWNIMVEPDAASANRVVASNGATNVFGWLPCSVSPAAPYRYDPQRNELLGALVGQKVRVSGTWCDVKDAAGQIVGTMIVPIAWIVIDRGLSPIIEEHGFSQVIRDYDIYAFSDDRHPDPAEPVPHHRENRHLEFAMAFPPRPQSNVPAVYSECDDRSIDEATVYDYKQKTLPKRYPLRSVAGVTYAVNAVAGVDELQVKVDTGTPAAQQGFLYAKLALTYDEPFKDMCLPDVCLTDPARACLFTGETRRTWAWPRLQSARVGDIVAGPAGGEGVLGRLLGALEPTQRFDHVVMFVEDDGNTVRHCTDSDARLKEKVYINGRVRVTTPFGDADEKVPLRGLRSDVVQFGWPGTISQSLGEVTVTGRNRLNAPFGHGQQYAALIANEGANTFPLWTLAPAEREKRTAFHDPEATESARAEKDAGLLLHFGLPRLQKDPAFRADGVLWPKLIKPHPYLDAQARATLAIVAQEARSIAAHYRFFAYSKSQIATDPAFVAPPAGDPFWRHPGSDWAAGTVAAMCSSFIWAACRAANDVLASQNRPLIELEGEPEPTDDRPPTDFDGLYQYKREERLKAGRALYEYMYGKVTDELNAALDGGGALASALLAVLNIGGTVDDIKDHLASVVANQVCNTFASDDPNDFTPTWHGTDDGVAVSPDDLFRNWDVQAKPDDPNPPLPGNGRVNVYGYSLPVAVPDPGWVDEPIYRISPVVGQGKVRGAVVGRLPNRAEADPIVGATVRLGCQVDTTDPEGWSFDPVKAGRYRLQASMFVIDPVTNVGLEWTSKAEDIEIHDGDDLSGIVLELLPPPGLARTVFVRHHTDIVDRRVVGKDDWGHFDLDDQIQLAFDPRDNPAVAPEQINTKIDGHSDKPSPEVGSGVHVRVKVDASLESVTNPDGSKHYDGKVRFNVHFSFYDTDEGETDATFDDNDVVLRPGDPPYEKPYNYVSDDTVPERASGKIVIHVVPAVLPGTN